MKPRLRPRRLGLQHPECRRSGDDFALLASCPAVLLSCTLPQSKPAGLLNSVTSWFGLSHQLRRTSISSSPTWDCVHQTCLASAVNRARLEAESSHKSRTPNSDQGEWNFIYFSITFALKAGRIQPGPQNTIPKYFYLNPVQLVGQHTCVGYLRST